MCIVVYTILFIKHINICIHCSAEERTQFRRIDTSLLICHVLTRHILLNTGYRIDYCIPIAFVIIFITRYGFPLHYTPCVSIFCEKYIECNKERSELRHFLLKFSPVKLSVFFRYYFQLFSEPI